MSTRGTLVRFAAVGVINTLIDVGLFVLLHGPLGVLLANFVSTSAGMTFSFVVNGLFTFRSERLTLRHLLLFLSTTGTVLWVLQPLFIHGALVIADGAGFDDESTPVVLAAKLSSVVLSFACNFLAYRYVVWKPEAPERGTSSGASRAQVEQASD